MALYNLKSPAVKRLMREAEELRNPTEEYYAQPLEDNLFEWHFTLRGPPNTEFEGGIYHGRITLPTDYPMKPPSIILLTPNGRFEINKKICLSISGHHPESWQPSWSIRTALLAIIGFLPTHGNGAIGSLDYTAEERKQLALRSQIWQCSECGCVKDFLKNPDTKEYCETKTEMQNTHTPVQFENNENSSSNIMQDVQDIESASTVEEAKNPSNGLNELAENIPILTNAEISNDQDITSTLRHRTVIACDTSSIPVASNEAEPMNMVQATPAYNWSSIVIWVISLILVILIIRRWIYFV